MPWYECGLFIILLLMLLLEAVLWCACGLLLLLLQSVPWCACGLLISTIIGVCHDVRVDYRLLLLLKVCDGPWRRAEDNSM